MKTANAAIQMRRQFKHQFYKNNHLAMLTAMAATILLAFASLFISWQMKLIIDIAAGGTGKFSLGETALMCAATLGVMFLLLLMDYYVRPRFIHKAMRQYKDYAFEQMIKKSIHSFNNERTSTYISALSNDANSIENNYLLKLFSLVENIIMFFGAFAMMIYFSPLLTLVAFLLSLLPVVISLLTGSRLAVQEKQVSDRNESFVGLLKDTLGGFSVIKSFKAEAEVFRLFAGANKDTEEAKCRRQRTECIITAVGAVAQTIAQFGVFLFGAWLAMSGRGVTAGVVLVFVQLMNYVLIPISQVPQILANKKAADALIDKLAAALAAHVRQEGAPVECRLEEGICLDYVTFAYEEGAPALQDVSARFEAGKSYAVVGASGSGKSTLLNLIMGSSDNYQGEIMYDSHELRSIHSDALYDLISIVQQNVFVFNSSISDNITMFRKFDEARVRRAVEMSGLADFISARGADYPCGENGSGLSGGERQRISIARCLLRETPVLLVDEATASLDTATAFAVTNSILDISGLTRIIVTHRLEEALLCKYDGILVMKNGRIEERGTFAELMERKGYFYSLFTVSQ